ncbi:MAG: hypothetical protein ABI675_15160 [Chitinophagaceae bacterium]
MFTYKLKTLVIMFITGLAIGIVSSLLFYGCNTGISKPVTTNVQPKELRKQAESSFAKYQHEISGLEVKNQQLIKELNSTKVLLGRTKRQTAARATRIKELSQRVGFPAKDLLQKVKAINIGESSPLPCDTLAQEVWEYMQENAVKDSLYESQVNLLDSSLLIKDSVIQTQEQQQKELAALFEKSVLEQEVLTSENKQLRKQFRRQKFRSTLKTIGLILLSGAATHYLTGK